MNMVMSYDEVWFQTSRNKTDHLKSIIALGKFLRLETKQPQVKLRSIYWL
jgi:hypothetical protein